MTFRELVEYWKSDYRGYRKYGTKHFNILVLNPCFHYSFFLRLCAFLKYSKYHIILSPLYILNRLILRHYTFKYGITIPYKTKIGHCFNIAHFSGIFISDAAIIGNNVVVSQGVTIGSTRTGVPKIGDNVYMGAGAKVIGGIVVGNNVAIGANCVVAKDIPDNAVVMGYPCKVVSYKGNDHT